ncbi:hypothetical protein B0H12DRAFT_1228861 [Mycena haematopus]|nr:hypothetical protein B0H12DRAFT_1228861 [Mycena haematopus]
MEDGRSVPKVAFVVCRRPRFRIESGVGVEDGERVRRHSAQRSWWLIEAGSGGGDNCGAGNGARNGERLRHVLRREEAVGGEGTEERRRYAVGLRSMGAGTGRGGDSRAAGNGERAAHVCGGGVALGMRPACAWSSPKTLFRPEPVDLPERDTSRVLGRNANPSPYLGNGLFLMLDGCPKLATLGLRSCRGVRVGDRRRFFERLEDFIDDVFGNALDLRECNRRLLEVIVLGAKDGEGRTPRDMAVEFKSIGAWKRALEEGGCDENGNKKRGPLNEWAAMLLFSSFHFANTSPAQKHSPRNLRLPTDAALEAADNLLGGIVILQCRTIAQAMFHWNLWCENIHQNSCDLHQVALERDQCILADDPAPLPVVVIHRAVVYRTDGPYPTDFRRPTITPIDTAAAIHIQNALETNSLIEREVRRRVAVLMEDTIEQEVQRRLAALPWPKLRALAIHVSDNPSTVLADCQTMIAPLLTSVATSYLTPTLLRSLPRLHLISTVEVFNREQSCLSAHRTGASLEDFLQIVGLFPLLEQLTITIDDILHPLPLTSEPVTLPFLHRLQLSSSQAPLECTWNYPWITSMLWTYISAPSLKELSVPQRWFEMGAVVELNEFFEHTLADRWRIRHQAAWPHSIVQALRFGNALWWDDEGGFNSSLADSLQFQVPIDAGIMDSGMNRHPSEMLCDLASYSPRRRLELHDDDAEVYWEDEDRMNPEFRLFLEHCSRQSMRLLKHFLNRPAEHLQKCPVLLEAISHKTARGLSWAPSAGEEAPRQTKMLPWQVWMMPFYPHYFLGINVKPAGINAVREPSSVSVLTDPRSPQLSSAVLSNIAVLCFSEGTCLKQKILSAQGFECVHSCLLEVVY